MKSYKSHFLMAAFGLMLSGCGDDSGSNASSDDQGNSDGQKYVFSFMMETSQYVGIASLSDDQSKVVKNFVEATNSGSVMYFNGSVYVLAADNAMNSTLSRYEVKDGKMADKASATAKFTGTQSIAMKFVDKNKMYVEQALGDVITALDPTTLKETANKMYVCLNQFVDFTNMIAGPRASVAIINTKTDKVEKVVYSDKVSAVGGMDDMNGTASFVDEKGDVYFYSNASYGFVEGYKEGWVRIKKGESEFDKDWIFRMNETEYDGKKTNDNHLMVGGTYMGDGKFMGFFGDFEDPTNFNNYEWYFVVVDVYKKTIKKLDLSPTIPWFAPSIHLDADGKSVLLGHADSKGGAIYRYDIASGKVKKEMSVKTGTAYYIVPIKD